MSSAIRMRSIAEETLAVGSTVMHSPFRFPAREARVQPPGGLLPYKLACAGCPRRQLAMVRSVKLDGIHHITAITENGQRNVDFYVGVLGLRLVKKTVNQDNPTVYHLFYADERGDPGSDLTFFEYPGIPQGRAGDGMVHRIVWRVASADALGFWADR